MKYNDLHVPPIIRCDRILSAFHNIMDWDKVEEYTEIMKAEMLSHDFPPIKGYPIIITEDEIGDFFLGDDSEEVNEDHIGQIVWKVTDGHHRATAAANAGLPHIEVELDYSCITSQEELKQFN